MNVKKGSKKHELIPELEELVEKGLHSKDEAKQNAAKKRY